MAEESDRPQRLCAGAGDPATIIKACSTFLAGGTASASSAGEAYRFRGMARGEDGDPDGAIEVLTRALALNPRDTDAFHRRGDVHLGQDRLDLAQADYEAALALDRDYLFSWLQLADIHGQQKRYVLAEQAYGEAIRVQPDNPTWQMLRGQLYSVMGRTEAALADLEEVAERSPVLAADTAIRRAILRSLAGRFEQALALCNEVVALGENLSSGYFCEGVIYLHAKRADDAIDAFERALAAATDPGLPPTWRAWPLYGRGVARRLRGDAAGDEDMRAAQAMDAALIPWMEIAHIRP